MVQNLKVDIIYHSTPSDFEMEFNLCGCCRMRLLNDKTTDKKSFIKSLARAVSRSRVIMACGPLFGADGLISTVATAIGGNVTPCDNATYGIKGDDVIEIINGSTPLVTPDGYFGGCIIESGPQTIILLTENRGFRKSIMQNLIHPYIEDISYIPTKTPVAPKVEEEPIVATVAQSQEYITEPDLDYGAETDIMENAYEASLPTDEHHIEFIMDEDSNETDPQPDIQPLPTTDQIFDNLYTEIESDDEIKERYEHPYVPSESDNMFLATPQYHEEDEYKVKSTNNVKIMNVSIVILILLLLLAVLALVYLVILRPMSMGISTADYLKEIFGVASGNTLV